jgi:hypothetical protein
LVDGAHAAPPDQLDDFVLADHLRHRAGVSCSSATRHPGFRERSRRV